MKKEKNTYKNYQKSSIKISKCKDCTQNQKCRLIYDQHHDQHFSKTCGKIIMQSNNYLQDYPADPLFWETQKQKREEKKQLQKILKKIQEFNRTYTILDEYIQINEPLTPNEVIKIGYICEETPYTLTKKKETYIIIKEKQKGVIK